MPESPTKKKNPVSEILERIALLQRAERVLLETDYLISSVSSGAVFRKERRIGREIGRGGEKNLAKEEMKQITSDSVKCPKCGNLFTPVGPMIKPDGSIQCGKCFARFRND